jgi:hypothetical protein
MRVIATAALLLPALLLLSCGTSTAPEPSPPELIPLAVGNKWIGEYRDFDTAGQHFRTRRDSVVVTRDTLVEGEKVYLMNGRLYVANRAEGHSSWSPVDHTWFLQYRYPAVAGDTYFLTGDWVYGNDTLRTTVIATDEVVDVGGRRYTCHHYFRQSNFGQYDVHMYIAPGVGTVKMRAVDRPGDGLTLGTTEWELKEHTLR